MRAIKSKGNLTTEKRLVAVFREMKLCGWRRNYNLVGKPDFVFPKKRIAVFADGCFWHGHDCRNTSPKTNADYWRKKIARNKERDKKVSRLLRQKGWRVFRIFECDIKKSKIPKAFFRAF